MLFPIVSEGDCREELGFFYLIHLSLDPAITKATEKKPTRKEQKEKSLNTLNQGVIALSIMSANLKNCVTAAT